MQKISENLFNKNKLNQGQMFQIVGGTAESTGSMCTSNTCCTNGCSDQTVTSYDDNGKETGSVTTTICN